MADNFNSRDSQNWAGGDHSDESIQREIMRRIEADPFLKSKNIDVQVSGGIATLHGALPSEMAGDMLINMVEGVPGVSGVNHDGLAIGDEAGVQQPQGAFSDRGGRTVDEDIPAGIPITGEETDVMSEETVTMERKFGEHASIDENAAHINRADDMAADLAEGMLVVDREGHKVGKVRRVRSTDFRMERGLFSHDLYVPYEACTFEGDHVALKVLASEVNDQGWATPGHSDDQFTNLMGK